MVRGKSTSFLLGAILMGASTVAAHAQFSMPANQPAPAAAANAQSSTPQPASPAPASDTTTAAAVPGQNVFVVPAGTKIPLSLRSPLSTKTAKPGDAVYLNSEFPVIVGSRVVIPAGVYVQGYVDGLQKAGKVKGRAQLMMHFVSMVFPNGQVIALPGAVDKVPGASQAQVTDKEGLIQQQSNGKGADAKTIAGTTLTGAGIGGIAGLAGNNGGLGLGVGAGAGAAAGLLETMMKHGDDISFPAGTTVVMVMQRPLEVQEQQLAGMSNLTGYDGPPMTPANAVQAPMPKPKAQSN